MSATLRTLVVCHSYRERDEVIRIISAHKAGKIRLDEQTLRYFEDLFEETEIPYQTLINLYL